MGNNQIKDLEILKKGAQYELFKWNKINIIIQIHESNQHKKILQDLYDDLEKNKSLFPEKEIVINYFVSELQKLFNKEGRRDEDVLKVISILTESKYPQENEKQ